MLLCHGPGVSETTAGAARTRSGHQRASPLDRRGLALPEPTGCLRAPDPSSLCLTPLPFSAGCEDRCRLMLLISAFGIAPSRFLLLSSPSSYLSSQALSFCSRERILFGGGDMHPKTGGIGVKHHECCLHVSVGHFLCTYTKHVLELPQGGQDRPSRPS